MSDLGFYEAPWWFRLFGGRHWATDGCHRMRWGELSFSSAYWLAISVNFFEEEQRYSLQLACRWLSLFIHIPVSPRVRVTLDAGEILRPWGFHLLHGERALSLEWGRWRKTIEMPFGWTHVRHSILCADGGWHQTEHYATPPCAHVEDHPYRYVLRSGEVQERTASVTVEEREWRWRWLRWLPWPRLVVRSIDVRFDDEVGERTGSWKGGTVGCGWAMRRGELPVDTLRRMEQERIFR